MLKMKDGVHWVELPKDLEPKMPDAGVTVEYQFTEKHTNYHPGGIKRIEYNYNVALPSIFTIRIGNKVVTLGLVGGYDERGNPNPGEIQQLDFKPQAGGGKLYVHPDQGDEQLSIYQALELHPMVGGNSSPDKTTPKVMVKVDHVSEAKKRIDGRNAKRKADNLATGLEGEALTRAALLLGVKYEGRDEMLVRDDIEMQAASHPETFILKLEDKDGDIKAEIAKGIALGTVIVDHDASQLKWGDNKGSFLTLMKADAESVGEEFANFVNNEKAGAPIYKQLQTLNKAKAKTANAEK